MGATVIPYIDPNVEHVGTSRLRELNSKKLRSMDKTLVIQENDTPLAVLLDYEQFLYIQSRLRSLLETIDLLTNENEVASLKGGLNDLKAGRTKSILEIRASLKKKKKVAAGRH